MRFHAVRSMVAYGPYCARHCDQRGVGKRQRQILGETPAEVLNEFHRPDFMA